MIVGTCRYMTIRLSDNVRIRQNTWKKTENNNVQMADICGTHRRPGSRAQNIIGRVHYAESAMGRRRAERARTRQYRPNTLYSYRVIVLEIGGEQTPVNNARRRAHHNTTTTTLCVCTTSRSRRPTKTIVTYLIFHTFFFFFCRDREIYERAKWQIIIIIILYTHHRDIILLLRVLHYYYYYTSASLGNYNNIIVYTHSPRRRV